MKMYEKNELTYKNGYICKGARIIRVGNEIVRMANELEYMYQKALHDEKQPKQVAAEEFAFRSERVHPVIQVETPALDEKVEQTMKVMNELDAIEKAEKVNNVLRELNPLVEWTIEDFAIDHDDVELQMRFDLKTLGNPLEWDKEFVTDKRARIYL